jgi:hypothetical protein
VLIYTYYGKLLVYDLILPGFSGGTMREFAEIFPDPSRPGAAGQSGWLYSLRQAAVFVSLYISEIRRVWLTPPGPEAI